MTPVVRNPFPATFMSIAILLLAISAAPIQASFTPIPLPDAAYTSSTTLIPITGPDFDTTLALSDANLTITFSTLMEKFTAGSSWSNWSSPPAAETSTPRVLSPFDFTLNTVTLSFSEPLATFGLEAEPDALTQGSFPVRLDFFNGVTPLGTITNVLDGTTSALFAATSMTPITSVTITVEGTMNDPAGTDPGIAQLRYALAATPPNGVPEGGPSVWFIAGTVLMLFTLHRLRYARR